MYYLKFSPVLSNQTSFTEILWQTAALPSHLHMLETMEITTEWKGCP